MSIIKIEGLSKKYIIGHDKAASGMYKYHSLRDSLAHTARGIAQRLRHPLSPNTETTDIEEFYALKDINLEIEQGDKVGIIGRNGAGKSTLLKILSRITEPTSGKITMNGRVASLLEVGTGFHPELSGRENIYLNGAVLGMTRKEIKKKFDEIVDFAGVEKFLDTPVKRYSSGMYVRLAFAVAAHLDPEILLIDEVLAVGDAEFQKKCLGKMDEVSKQGRTILFVSHNMAAIQQLCIKGFVLNEGNIDYTGNVVDSIHHYNMLLVGNLKSDSKAGKSVKVIDVRISKNDEQLTANSSLNIFIQLSTLNRLPNCYLNLVIEDSEGRMMIHTRTDFFNVFPTLEAGNHNIVVRFERISLRVGIYSLWFRLYCNKEDIYELVDSDRIILEVVGSQIGGFLDIPCQWTLDGKQI